jgi:hypothetical protein
MPVSIPLVVRSPGQSTKLTAHVVSPPRHGILDRINEVTSNVTYTPNQDFTGADKFEFKVNDGKVDSKTGNVSITVNPTSNHAPTANNQSVVTSIDKPISIILSASDKDNDNLSAKIQSGPVHGTLSSINENTGEVTYTPKSGFVGTDSFRFKVNDGKVDSKTGNVSIVVK